MALRGIDISQWEPTTPSLSGLAFVVCRATYGTGYDTRYAHHAAIVRKAGLALGAYGFGINGDGAAQAQALLATAPDADFYALDLEPEANKPRMTDAQARAFIAEMHRKGVKCGLYHSKSGFPKLGQDWDWIAAWDGIDPGSGWTFHQYTGGPLDHDEFHGDAQALAAFVKENRMATKPAAGTPAAEPLVYAGVITGVLVSAGLITTEQATGVTPAIAALIGAAFVVFPLIMRQFVTPNGKVDPPVTPPPADPPVVTPEPEPLAIVDSKPLADTMIEVAAGTRRWSTDGKRLSDIGPSTLVVTRMDNLSGPINGHFYLTGTHPPYYVANGDGRIIDRPVAPAPVPYEPGPAPATNVSDASYEGNLTGPEYTALVNGAQTPIDFVAQCKAWNTANLGTRLYLEQLYVRLNAYCNAYKAGRRDVTGAIGEIVRELYAAEQISTGTGVGPVDRNIPFDALVQQWGSYVTAPPDLQSILAAAKP